MNDLKNFLFSIKYLTWPDFTKLIKWSYLTDNAVPVESSLLAFFAYFFIILILVGIIAGIILARKQRHLPIYSRLRGHIVNMTTWTSIIGLFLVISRYQAIYFFSSRLLLLGDLIILTGWTMYIAFCGFYRLPKDRQKYEKQQRFERYLPKAKKAKSK